MTSAAKEQARRTFTALHQNFMAALAGAACLNQPEHLECLTEGTGQAAIIGLDGRGTAFPLDDIQRALRDDKEAVLSGFVKMNFRVVMLESYEALVRYCKATDQYKHPLKDQPWFDFFRFIRDAMGHDVVWKFSSRDKRKLPITWNGITIHEGLSGQPVTFAMLKPDTAFDLLQTAQEFLVNDLQ